LFISSLENKVSEPKYNIKFTFDLDENDFNLIREYIEPDIKFRGIEFEEKEEFLKIDINKDNYFKVFNQDLIDDPVLIKDYYENNCCEFKDDIQTMLSNNNPKKVHKKQKNNKNNDFLIFDVNKNVFYKKIQNFNNNNTSICLMNDINNNSDNKNNKGSNMKIRNFLDSPKMIVKVLKLPINFIDDYII